MITTKEDIIQHFQRGIKNKDNFKIGVEHEKFIFNKSRKRADFQTINKIFDLLKNFGWRPIFEENNIIALKKKDCQITLEPGNQIELSGAQLNSIHLACEESYRFLSELKQACESLDLKMMSVGYDPFSTLQNVSKTPKQRYEVMTEVMPKNGKLSLEMMYQTCGTQINLDYTSEKNFIKKFKLSSFLVPLSVAIFANSPIKENKSTGYFSYRSKVWQHTSRAGLPRIFLEEMDFEKYTDMAINMPLLFILKDTKYVNATGNTFKDFMEGKIDILKNKKPTIQDFKNHLSTIFTEIRLKQYIEIRSLDTCEWDCHCGGPALYMGLLYANLDEALEIVNEWSITDVLNAYAKAPKDGLNTVIHSKTLLEWGKIFLQLSKEGLQKRSIKNKGGSDESIFLRSIENILINNETKAENSIKKFEKGNSLEFLYDKT